VEADQPHGGTSAVAFGGHAPPDTLGDEIMKCVPEHPLTASGVHVGAAAIG
jgi:hypothetical protein